MKKYIPLCWLFFVLLAIVFCLGCGSGEGLSGDFEKTDFDNNAAFAAVADSCDLKANLLAKIDDYCSDVSDEPEDPAMYQSALLKTMQCNQPYGDISLEVMLFGLGHSCSTIRSTAFNGFVVEYRESADDYSYDGSSYIEEYQREYDQYVDASSWKEMILFCDETMEMIKSFDQACK